MKEYFSIVRRIGYGAARRLGLVPPSAETVTRANTREAYDLLYSRDDLLRQYLEASRLAFYEEVAEYCASFCGSRIVDLGCGAGHFLHALKGRIQSSGRQAQLYGIDHSHAAIRRASRLLVDGRFTVGDILATDYESDFFDLVLSIETFEHLSRPDLALEEAARICRPSGAIVLTVPNGDLDRWEGHLNFWNSTQFRAFLAQNPQLEVGELLLIEHGRSLLACLTKVRTPTGE